MNDVPCPGCGSKSWIVLDPLVVCRTCGLYIDGYAYGILKIPAVTFSWFPCVFWFLYLLIMLVALLNPGP